MPVPAPVTHPLEATIATPKLLLLHVPLAVASVRQFVEPTQIFLFPVIAAGLVLTVTLARATQPNGEVAIIIVAPPDTPVTTPVAGPTEAIATLPLLQVTPGVMSVSAIVLPTQTVDGPVIGAVALIVTVTSVAQPVPIV